MSRLSMESVAEKHILATGLNVGVHVGTPSMFSQTLLCTVAILSVRDLDVTHSQQQAVVHHVHLRQKRRVALQLTRPLENDVVRVVRSRMM